MQSKNTNFTALATLQDVCMRQNVPFISFKLPQDKTITTHVQYHKSPTQITDLLTINHMQGFIIAPFSEKEGYKTFLLKPDISFEDDNISTETLSEIENCKLFLDTTLTITETNRTTSRTEFEQNVQKAVKAMKQSAFQKVVLSKTQLINSPEGFSASAFYQILCKKYPHAFVYILQLPEVGCWVGATPEPLLTSNNDSLRTVSLAGTQPATDAPVESYIWSDKEIEEQGIVTGFIENTLRNAGIANFKKFPLENYRAANLIHLKSGFEFNKSELVGGLSALIKALHPTPSVGGLPKQEAFEFIRKTESHKRSYYTGFLGTINPDGTTSLFVNLRCMQIIKNQILLYSGAGITASSVPENEWIETENKLLTLKQVIFTP